MSVCESNYEAGSHSSYVFFLYYKSQKCELLKNKIIYVSLLQVLISVALLPWTVQETGGNAVHFHVRKRSLKIKYCDNHSNKRICIEYHCASLEPAKWRVTSVLRGSVRWIFMRKQSQIAHQIWTMPLYVLNDQQIAQTIDPSCSKNSRWRRLVDKSKYS